MEESPDGVALVSATAGVPLHRQLFLVMHDEISRGALAAGAALPTEQALCDQFGVSRITVRRALADLAEAGLVDRRHGIGSFVAEHLPVVPETATGSYLDKLRQIDFETDVDVVEFGQRPLPPVIGERWDSRDTALHVLRVRRERRTGEPLMITEAWLPVELGEVITREALARAPLYQLLSEAQIELEYLEHDVTAEVAGPRTASLLRTVIGSPLIRVHRVAFAKGAPHHVLSIALSPSRSRIVINLASMDMESGGSMSIAHDVLRPTS